MATAKPRRLVINSPEFEEAVRTLRNSIMLTDFDRRLKCILMTSASPSEGKSTVAAHLAIAHAEQGHRTLLIDGDMRRPSLHKLFGVENAAGLSKVLEHQTDWHEVLLKPRPDLELQIMPAGPSTRRAADLVGQATPETTGSGPRRIRSGDPRRAAASRLPGTAPNGGIRGRSASW